MTATAFVGDYTRTLRGNTERTRPIREPEPPVNEERWTVEMYLREVKGQVIYGAGGGVAG